MIRRFPIIKPAKSLEGDQYSFFVEENYCFSISNIRRHFQIAGF